MFLNSSNQLNVLVTITFCEKVNMIISFCSAFLASFKVSGFQVTPHYCLLSPMHPIYFWFLIRFPDTISYAIICRLLRHMGVLSTWRGEVVGSPKPCALLAGASWQPALLLRRRRIFPVVVIGVVVTWTRYENIWTVAFVQSPQVAVPDGSSRPHIFLKFPQLSSSFFQFCPDKTGRNRPKVIEFFALCYQTVPINQMHIIFCKKLSMMIIFFQHFWHLSQFFPVLSSFFQFCPDKTGRNRFLPLFSGCPGRNSFLPEETQPCLKAMMTSSNGNIFCLTGHLCGELTCLRWIPRTKANDAGLWCFLWSAPE